MESNHEHILGSDPRPPARQEAVAAVAAAGALAVALAACTPGGTDAPAASDDASTGGGDDGTFTIGISWSALQTEYFVGLKDAVDAAAAKVPGLKVIHVNANDDPVTQLDQLEDLASQSPDVIVVNPADSEAESDGVRSLAERFPVFTLDRQVTDVEDVVVTHVGTSAEEGGYNEAQLVCQEVGKDAKFLGIWASPASRPPRPASRA